MATAPPTTKPPPPRAPAGAPAAVTHAPKRGVTFSKTAKKTGHRVVEFGEGGIGKTTLACMAPGPVAIFDLDDSLPRLQAGFIQQGLDVRQVEGCDSWEAIRCMLHGDGWDGIETIVIDSITKAEELAIAHTLATVPGEGGSRVTRIEGYGYGKGYQHVYDTFLPLLGDLDQHIRVGRNVILVAHCTPSNVPNPQGNDWIRYEPRLQTTSGWKASIRLRVREWADHLLFIGYDVSVNKDGKGVGSGTRTMYPTELPHCMAKSRTLSEPMPIVKYDASLWTELLKG